ncbi:MAG: hypothetical protein IPN17_08590 [Deltaproteobacteria bacterium]|nr:hypothetical protein [Deltaproteobacteria bacterium]
MKRVLMYCAIDEAQVPRQAPGFPWGMRSSMICVSCSTERAESTSREPRPPSPASPWQDAHIAA